MFSLFLSIARPYGILKIADVACPPSPGEPLDTPVVPAKTLVVNVFLFHITTL